MNVDGVLGFRDQQRQDGTREGQPAQDIEDRVHPEAGGEEQAAEQRAADTA